MSTSPFAAHPKTMTLPPNNETKPDELELLKTLKPLPEPLFELEPLMSCEPVVPAGLVPLMSYVPAWLELGVVPLMSAVPLRRELGVVPLMSAVLRWRGRRVVPLMSAVLLWCDVTVVPLMSSVLPCRAVGVVPLMSAVPLWRRGEVAPLVAKAREEELRLVSCLLVTAPEFPVATLWEIDEAGFPIRNTPSAITLLAPERN